ncbi:hypothetical protein LEN26_020889 [Aphanomyces euteiches]|nr:hypothetical protein LEN26_020889 [Aphanomyces euteiches]
MGRTLFQSELLRLPLAILNVVLVVVLAAHRAGQVGDGDRGGKVAPSHCEALQPVFVLHWIRFNRWHLVVVAFLNLFCVGSIFSMDFLDDTISGFFLDKAANSALSCQLVGMVTMGFAAALSGPFIESRGPRVSMAIATGLVVLGWICALFSVMFRVYPHLNIGFGVLVSAGYGITMLVSVATAQKWFPDLRGIVSGICIAGMSGGSLV